MLLPCGKASGSRGRSCRGLTVEGAVGPRGVVDPLKGVELGLQLGDCARRAASRATFEGLVEPLDLALGLGVVDPAVLLLDL